VDARLTGHEIRWMKEGESEWRRQRVGRSDPCHIDGLPNGDRYSFQVRALAGNHESPWSKAAVVEVAPVGIVDTTSAADGAPLGLLLRTFW
jgi:hypothetical protein